MLIDPFRKRDQFAAVEQVGQRGLPPRIEPGRLISVHPETFTADVQPDGDNHIVHGVPLLFPYEHPNGAGLYFLPEPGAHVLLLYYDRGGPRVLIARNEHDGQGYRGPKDALRLGDTILRTPTGAHLLLRRSGLGEWKVSPTLRMALLPHTNTFFVRGENIDLRCLGGRWRWSYDRGGQAADLPNRVNTAGRTLLRQEYYDEADRHQYGPRLIETRGYHSDGSLLTLHYTDTGPSYEAEKALGRARETTFRLGALPEDEQRLTLDCDNGMYRYEGGEKEDGTVERRTIQARPQPRTWSITEKKGKQDDDDTLVEQTLEVLGQTVARTRLDAQGQARIELASGKVTLRVEPTGRVLVQAAGEQTTLEITEDGHVNLTLDGTVTLTPGTNQQILLGSEDADEPVVLGNAWKSMYNTFRALFNAHVHIGNMGSPTSPPTVSDNAPLGDSQLSNVAFTERR